MPQRILKDRTWLEFPGEQVVASNRHGSSWGAVLEL